MARVYDRWVEDRPHQPARHDDHGSLAAFAAAVGNGAFGATVARSTAGPGVVRWRAPALAVMRDIPSQMAAAANEDEAQAYADHDAEPTELDRVTNVQDVQGAEALRDRIMGANADLLRCDDYEPRHGEANATTVGAIEHYLQQARTQGGAISDFQTQVVALDGDYARLMAQLTQYGQTHQGRGTLAGTSQGSGIDMAETGRRQIASVHAGAGEYQALLTSQRSSVVAGHDTAAHAWHERMETAAQQIGSTMLASNAAEAALNAATDRVGAHCLERERDRVQGERDAAEAQIAALRAQADELKRKVGYVVQAVKAAIKIAQKPDPATMLSAGADAATYVFEQLANDAATHHFDDQIAAIRRAMPSTGPLSAAMHASELSEKLNQANAQKTAYLRAAAEYIAASNRLERAQDEYRRSMRLAGTAADRATGGRARFSIVAQLRAEAEAYLAQSTATRGVGAAEREAGRSADTALAAVNTQALGSDGSPRSEGLQYYVAGRRFQRSVGDDVGFHRRVEPRRALIVTGGADSAPGHGSAAGAHGANDIIERTLERLQQREQEVRHLASTLAEPFESDATSGGLGGD